MKINNENGMSLMGVLIAAAIMGVLSVAAIKLMELMSKGHKSSMQNFNITSSAEEMRLYLTTEEACTASLQNYDVLSEAEFVLKNKAGEEKFKKGTKLENGVTVQRLYIKRPDVLTDPYRGALNAILIAERSFKKDKSTTKRILKVIANVKGNKITKCLSYETEAIESSIKRSCTYTGGKINAEGDCVYDEINKDSSLKGAVKKVSTEQMCDYFGGFLSGDSCVITKLKDPFKKLVQESACEMLGGNLVGNKCLNIKINK